MGSSASKASGNDVSQYVIGSTSLQKIPQHVLEAHVKALLEEQDRLKIPADSEDIDNFDRVKEAAEVIKRFMEKNPNSSQVDQINQLLLGEKLSSPVSEEMRIENAVRGVLEQTGFVKGIRSDRKVQEVLAAYQGSVKDGSRIVRKKNEHNFVLAGFEYIWGIIKKVTASFVEKINQGFLERLIRIVVDFLLKTPIISRLVGVSPMRVTA
ncbi:hypothetical protein M569_05093 [Genlisea aurea]|uniref:Uncharacterized protein n=1 Tax=Genlisea aurea TaxID=192259 RepID=S8CSA0_9LAMI|nr:hypothetical protein M569_05093 [Genlisea aurea]